MGIFLSWKDSLTQITCNCIIFSKMTKKKIHWFSQMMSHLCKFTAVPIILCKNYTNITQILHKYYIQCKYYIFLCVILWHFILKLTDVILWREKFPDVYFVHRSYTNYWIINSLMNFNQYKVRNIKQSLIKYLLVFAESHLHKFFMTIKISIK